MNVLSAHLVCDISPIVEVIHSSSAGLITNAPKCVRAVVMRRAYSK